jgi:carbohydrate kinase (thermoresistant glucokinase family)
MLDAAPVKIFVQHFQANAWKQSTVSKPRKQIIVLAGPCGSGKSTVTQQLSAAFNVPFVEGNELHTRDVIAEMEAGTPLDDVTRFPWLERVKQRALSTATELGHDKVFVSCFALKRAYRDKIRELERDNEDVRVVFLDLQVEEEELIRRMRDGGGHYMKEGMVESQLEIREKADMFETDVLPVDAGKRVEDVVDEVLGLLENV